MTCLSQIAKDKDNECEAGKGGTSSKCGVMIVNRTDVAYVVQQDTTELQRDQENQCATLSQVLHSMDVQSHLIVLVMVVGQKGFGIKPTITANALVKRLRVTVT